MSNEGGQGKALSTTSGEAKLPTTERAIKLGDLTQIDTTGLSPEQVQQLQIKHAEGMIDVNRKAQALKVEVGALGAGLDTMGTAVKNATEAGSSATITHSQTNTLGHTEVMLGNTETAAKGKLSGRQAGARDYTLYYVGLGALVIIVLAIVLTR
jgi:hypothetical protein